MHFSKRSSRVLIAFLTSCEANTFVVSSLTTLSWAVLAFSNIGIKTSWALATASPSNYFRAWYFIMASICLFLSSTDSTTPSWPWDSF